MSKSEAQMLEETQRTRVHTALQKKALGGTMKNKKRVGQPNQQQHQQYQKHRNKEKEEYMSALKRICCNKNNIYIIYIK